MKSINKVLYAPINVLKKIDKVRWPFSSVWPDPTIKITRELRWRFDIPTERYSHNWNSYSEFLIGTNIAHHFAGYDQLDMPLIVIDKHTELYNRPKCGAWVYYELLNGREVHLVLPENAPDLKDQRLCYLPYTHNLSIYSESDIEEISIRGHSFLIESFETLSKRCKQMEIKQVSVDEDFFGYRWKISSLNDIMSLVDLKEQDRFDFWVEGMYNTRVKHYVEAFSGILMIYSIH